MFGSLPEKTFFLLIGILLFSPFVFSQESNTIPEALRRPERGEAPRFPKDIAIGELGRGKAPEAAYQYAMDLMTILTAGNRDYSIPGDTDVLTDSLLEGIKNLEPRGYRLGGGRIEPDGSVSFLVRILGSEDSISGELFLRSTDSGVSAETTVSAENAASESSSEDYEEPDTASADIVSPEIVFTESAVPGGNRISGSVKWLFDDLILEEKRPLSEIKDSYRYDFSPYERFY